MKANNVITPLLVFVCLCLYTALELQPPCPDNGKKYEKENRILKERIDSLASENLILDYEYMVLQVRTDSLQESLSKTEKIIVELKDRKHEKINRIDSLNSNELYGFFSGLSTKDVLRRK